MANAFYDPTLDTSCDDCEEICATSGCDKLVMIGPCDAIVQPGHQFPYIPAEQLFFTQPQWCEVASANSLTYNPNIVLDKKGHLGLCYPRAKQLEASPTFDLDIDYCRFDTSHIYLESACKVAFMCMEDKSEFDPSIPASQLPFISYGTMVIEPGSTTKEFGTTETRSYTLHVSEYFWRLNHAVPATGLAAAALKSTRTTTDGA